MSKIKQIMPSDGWFAVFSGEGEEWMEPIVGWALVLDEGAVDVRALVADAGGGYAEDLDIRKFPGFVRLYHEKHGIKVPSQGGGP